MINADIIEINDEQAHDAKLLASTLSEAQVRKRGMIDILGIQCAMNYLNSNNIRVDNKKSVYKIPILFEEFKISDIYYGNYRVDVITLYKEKSIKIPRIHVDMDILPNFYFIIQIGGKIKEAKIIGFIEGKRIPACSHDSKFYYPSLDLIFDINKFYALTRHSLPSKSLLGKHVDCLGLFLKFIDNDLSSVYKRQLIQHLMYCDSCRSRFIDAIEFEKLANNIRFYPNLMRKTEQIAPNVNVTIEQTHKHTNIEDGLKNVRLEELPAQEISEPTNIVDDFETKNENKSSAKTVEMFDLSENANNSNVIDSIFKEVHKIEIQPIKTVINAKNRRVILISILVIFILSSFLLISFKGSSDTIDTENEMATFDEPFDDNEDLIEDDYYASASKIPDIQPISNQRSIDDLIVNKQKINNSNYTPTITKISWEAPESLVKKDTYTKYLQLIGKNIKLNLQNDLLLVNDIPINKIAKVDIRIAANGSIEGIKVSTSSGSNLIDKAIKKVVKETVTYTRPPSHGIISKPVDITLTVEMN